MDEAYLSTASKNERLAMVVDRCLQSTAAYQLLKMLSSISQLDQDDKYEYMEMVKDSGVYSEEEIYALERLILRGAANSFKSVIDKVREEQMQREIKEMLYD